MGKWRFALESGEDDEQTRLCRDIPESQCRPQPRNFALQALAQMLAKSGDALADPKVVLPWLLGAAGAPGFMAGLLVPIRESLALLPQILIGGVIRRFAVRKWFWVASSVVEGVAVLAMAAVAVAGFGGAAAGWSILGLLTLFSLARGVASVSSKDTLGKTVSKGRRGKLSGVAATGAGVAALAVGLFLIWSPVGERSDWALYAMIVTAGCLWIAGAVVYGFIAEYPGATDGGGSIGDLVRDQLALLIKDRELQKFLLARTLLISTALASPIYVTLAQRQIGGALSGLGWLLIAAGAAGFLSSWIWGITSDASSRRTMALAAALSAFAALTVVCLPLVMTSLSTSILFYASVLFVASVAHSGIRIGRKTHIVDMAGKGRKAEYVALSNTLIGVALIGVGGLTSLLLALGPKAALLALAALALAGAVASLSMRSAQA
ncbi:MAG: MFS transporter permease [Hoeflea sp.]|uniref:MFS transporter permease n=1 Tax=Hoeflea sp. TaxID=1940281 RepID=UPI003EF5F79C